MRILHVIDTAGIYGAEVMLLNLMEEQEKIGLTPLLLSMEEADSSESLFSEALRRGFKSDKVLFNRGYSIKNAFRVLNFAKENSSDLIHCHGYKGDILLGSIPRHKRKIPLISSLHGWIATKRFSKKWFYKLLDIYFLRRMDGIISVNPLLPPLGGKAKMYYVENGIPELKFEPRIEDSRVQNFCKEGFIIGTVCRLSEEKGLIYLIEAMKTISGIDASCKLLIIGEGPQRHHIEYLIKESNLSGCVMLAGYRDKAFHYLPMLDVFVLPSLTEGLPIIILEAMQARVPIIATSVGAIPKVLDNGKYGTLIKPADSEAIARAVSHIKSNYESAKKVATEARDFVLEMYSSRRMAESYLKVYRDVLENYNHSKGDK